MPFPRINFSYKNQTDIRYYMKKKWIIEKFVEKLRYKFLVHESHGFPFT